MLPANNSEKVEQKKKTLWSLIVFVPPVVGPLLIIVLTTKLKGPTYKNNGYLSVRHSRSCCKIATW